MFTSQYRNAARGTFRRTARDEFSASLRSDMIGCVSLEALDVGSQRGRRIATKHVVVEVETTAAVPITIDR